MSLAPTQIEYPSQSSVRVTWLISSVDVSARLSLAEEEVLEEIRNTEKKKDKENKKKKKRARVNKSSVMPDGFRHNKTPKGLIWRKHGNKIQERMLRTICPELWADLAEINPFNPIKAPHFSGRPEYGKNLEITAETEIFPRLIISPSKYRVGIRVTIPARRIATEQLVQQHLETQRQRYVKYKIPEQNETISMGDYVGISFAERISVSDSAWGERKSVGFILGSGQANPRIETEIIGMRIGEVKVVEIDSPNGQKIESDFRVEDHKMTNLPKDEELCQIEGQQCKFDLLCRYKDIIEERFEAEFLSNFRRAIIGRIVGTEAITLPQSMVDARYQMLEQESRIQSMKATVQYDDSPESCARLRQFTEMIVCEEIVLYYIAEQEGITADDVDVEAEIYRIAQRDGHSIEEAKQWLATANFREGARQQARLKKTLGWLKERTSVTEEVVIPL